MKSYIGCLELLLSDALFKAYSGLRALILWLSHAKPDLAPIARLIRSDVETELSPKLVQGINERLAWSHETANDFLTFPHLNPITLKLVTYADASFTNRRETSS